MKKLSTDQGAVPHKCCKLVSDGLYTNGYKCGKPGKVEHEGKWYCGIHNPVSAKARQDIHEKAANKMREAKHAAEKDKLEKANEQARRAACFDDLVSALEEMMDWHVKNASRWVNPAYDNAKMALAKAGVKPK